MPFVILSGERPNQSPARNAVRTVDLEKELHGSVSGSVVPVLGSYLGKAEKSFMVDVSDREDYEFCKALANSYDQESILLVDDNLTAHLVFGDGEILHIGTWVMHGMTAPKVDGWTLIGGLYFYCAPFETLPFGGYDGE